MSDQGLIDALRDRIADDDLGRQCKQCTTDQEDRQ